jgi:two-component system cell cycle sensor histidine kinase/response regulator CckA
MIEAPEKSEEQYKNIFEDAPLALGEIDLSQVKEYLDSIKSNEVCEIKQYFHEHPEGIRVCLQKIRIIAINKKAITLYGAATKEELIHNFAHTFPEKFLEAFKEQIIALIDGERSYEKESIVKTLDGKEMYVSIKWILPSEYIHTWSRVLVSIIDITEKKKAEELLRIQRDVSLKFSTFSTMKELCLQILKDVMQIEEIDSGGVYIRNPSTGEVNLVDHMGLSEEFISVTSHYDADSPQNRIILEGKPIYTEYTKTGLPLDDIRRKEGLKAVAIFPVKHNNEIIASLNVASHTYTEIPLSSRTIIESIGGMIGSFIARVEAELALRESEERYHMLLQNIPYVTWISDIDGNTVFISENVIDYYGFTPEEICSSGTLYWFDRIHPEDVERVKKAWLQLLDKGESFDMEYRIKRKDGKWIWIFDRAVNTYKKKGIPYAYGIFSDITSKKQMEEYFRHSEKMQAIGRLAGGIAHDFNNQLAAILIYVELLKGAVSGDPNLEAHVRNIISCIKYSSNMISQLLAFSKKGKFQSIQVDVHNLIMEVINILTHSIDKKIRVEKDFRAHLRFISGDPSQLENAILNIALNARDAITGSGTILFITDNVDLDQIKINEIPFQITPGTYILITVRDNGIGMNIEVLHRIFEPFFTTKEKGKGTGMGMAAVYGTVKNHKGGIRVISEQGKGSTVKIYLPVIDTACESGQTPFRKTTGKAVPAHILFVDDKKVMCKSVKTILTQAGYKVSICSDGREALDFYSKNWENVDLVILDMIMPEMNGFETFLKMREIHPDVKALLVSGYSREEEIQKAQEEGISGFIQKPFSLNDISEKIALVLDQKEE